MSTTKKKQTAKFELQDDANFIRFGGRVYILTDVGKCKLNDVIETTKTHFEELANQHTESISDELVELARTQEREQLEHLRVAQSSNVCVIQPNDFGKPVVAFANGSRGYSLIRTTIWRPTIMYFGPIGLSVLESCMRSGFSGGNPMNWPHSCRPVNNRANPDNVFEGTPHYEGWAAMCRAVRDDGAIFRIKVEEFIPPQVLLTYFNGSYIKFISLNGSDYIHPHCMVGLQLCTGQLSAVNFWNNNEYNRLLQDINWESFAARNFSYTTANGQTEFWNVVEDIRNMKILAITREEATAWRTRRT